MGGFLAIGLVNNLYMSNSLIQKSFSEMFTGVTFIIYKTFMIKILIK